MTTTAVVAWLGLVLAGTSLGWQVLSWLHTGARPVVSADSGVTSGRLGTAEFVAVEVHNAGRTATAVEHFGFIGPDGQLLAVFDSFMKPVELPKRLEPGDNLSFWYRTDDVREMAEQADCLVHALVPIARVGNKRVRGTWTSQERAEKLGPHYDAA